MIEQLIQKIAQGLDNANIPYMIIGGQAVLLYGTPRLTRDIDITLGVDIDKFVLIQKICKELGLEILPDKPEAFIRDTNVLPTEDTKSRIRVDFIFSFTKFEAQAINRTKKITMHDYPVKFASCEDVIIHKMIASRAIDIEDVKNMLIKNKKSIDLKYVQSWLLEFNNIPEYEGILNNFNRLFSL